MTASPNIATPTSQASTVAGGTPVTYDFAPGSAQAGKTGVVGTLNTASAGAAQARLEAVFDQHNRHKHGARAEQHVRNTAHRHRAPGHYRALDNAANRALDVAAKNGAAFNLGADAKPQPAATAFPARFSRVGNIAALKTAPQMAPAAKPPTPSINAAPTLTVGVPPAPQRKPRHHLDLKREHSAVPTLIKVAAHTAAALSASPIPATLGVLLGSKVADRQFDARRNPVRHAMHGHRPRAATPSVAMGPR